MENTSANAQNTNALQVFNFKNQQVDIIIIDGEPHFIGKQVCDILGYTNSRKALADHVDAEDKGVTKRYTPGGMQDTTIINESGLYSLILGSKLESAKEFKRWVTSEVLPSIRKTGKYETPKEQETDEQLISRAVVVANRIIAKMQDRISNLEETVAVQGMQIAEMNPKAAYYDMILNCKDVVSITTIAKDYGMSGCKLNDLLHEYGVQWKQNNVWVLYQKHAEQGYTNTKTHNYIDNHGEHKAKVHTYWTQKGRLFIYETLKREGILPLIEREQAA